MKSIFQYVKNFPALTQFHMIAQGAVITIAGLMMPRNNLGVIVGGVLFTVAAVVLVIGARLVSARNEVLIGEIVEVQQPQLTDVQAHTRRAPELPQAA